MSELRFNVMLPHVFYIPCPPTVPFFDPDGGINAQMVCWLGKLSAMLEVCEKCGNEYTTGTVYYVYVRHPSPGGIGCMRPCFLYNDKDEDYAPILPHGSDLPNIDIRFPEKLENPVICYFGAALKWWPDGLPIYLSDFRNDNGMVAQAKLIYSMNNLLARLFVDHGE